MRVLLQVRLLYMLYRSLLALSWLCVSTSRVQPLRHHPCVSNSFTPRISADYHLPHTLLQLGIKVFGSRAELTRILTHTHAPTNASANGVRIRLVQAPGDNSLQRCAWYGHTQPCALVEYRVYGNYLSPSNKYAAGSIVVDIGANLGDMAAIIARTSSGVQVLAVEPSPHTFFFLCWNLWLNGVRLLTPSQFGSSEAGGGVLAMNAAVSERSGNVTVRWSDTASQNAVADQEEYAMSATSATVPSNWHWASVPTFNLPDFLARHNIKEVHLMKIDCEGCEFRVIPAWADFFRDKLRLLRLTGEFHWRALDRTRGRFQEKPTDMQVNMVDEVLTARGCKTRIYLTSC